MRKDVRQDILYSTGCGGLFPRLVVLYLDLFNGNLLLPCGASSQHTNRHAMIWTTQSPPSLLYAHVLVLAIVMGVHAHMGVAKASLHPNSTVDNLLNLQAVTA